MLVASGYRPDPDVLLARVQGEERRKHRGKLKIFLGYIAGVGKTYEMLSRGEVPPPEFTRPEVAEVLITGMKRAAEEQAKSG